MKARRMRSGSPKPVLAATRSIGSVPVSTATRGLEAPTLDCLGWGHAGFGREDAGEIARAHRRRIRKALDRQRFVQPLPNPAEQAAETAVRPVQFEQGGELRLAARSAVINDKLLRSAVSHVVAEIVGD
jgi:hypothetical protein